MTTIKSAIRRKISTTPSPLSKERPARPRLLVARLAMASAKTMTEWASGIDHSTIVVTMVRNGTDFGVRVSGLGDEWFTAPAPTAFMRSFVPRGPGVQPWARDFGVVPLKRPGDPDVPPWTEEVAGRDMGDSAITETVGWAATLLANQLGFLPIVGCSLDQALTLTEHAPRKKSHDRRLLRCPLASYRRRTRSRGCRLSGFVHFGLSAGSIVLLLTFGVRPKRFWIHVSDAPWLAQRRSLRPPE